MARPHPDMKRAMKILEYHNRKFTFREIAKVMDIKLGTIYKSFKHVRHLSTVRRYKKLRTKKSVV